MKGITKPMHDGVRPWRVYPELTNTRSSHLRDYSTAHEPLELGAFLRQSITDGEGTPEFREWLANAARRRGLAVL